MKNFHAPNSNLRSSSAILADAGQVIPEKKTHWSVQKAVPHSVLVARAEADRKATLRAVADEMRAKHDAGKNVPKGLFAQTVEGGFKVLGFGVTVPTVAEVIALANREGRAFVKVDGQAVA